MFSWLKTSPLLLALTLAILTCMTGCRAAVQSDDPHNLVWDETPVQGFQRIQKLMSVEGIRVFSWNVAWGSLNFGNLDQNLTDLISSRARPHLLIFEEFKYSILKTETLTAIRAAYPFEVFAPYNSGLSEVGVMVFSPVPFTSSTPVNLDWTPDHSTVAQQDNYREAWKVRAPLSTQWWDRPYIRLHWEFNGIKLNLVPVHLLEPWDEIHKQWGKLDTWKDIFFGTDNPLMYQINRLKAHMREDFGAGLNSEPLLLIGDFNAPKRISAVTTKAFSTLQEGLEEVFSGNPGTFPAFSAPDRKEFPFKYLSVKIDHAFVNAEVDALASAVLPLKGSDHYPIYVVLRPRAP